MAKSAEVAVRRGLADNALPSFATLRAEVAKLKLEEDGPPSSVVTIRNLGEVMISTREVRDSILNRKQVRNRILKSVREWLDSV
jgi:hypothetical protein